MTNRDILDELRLRGELTERLKRIAPRFREIINLRYGLSFETGLIVRGEMTLEQVGKLYSITNERVRQIERRVFKELSEGLTDSPWHTGTPTEDGYYLCHFTDGDRTFDACFPFTNNTWNISGYGLNPYTFEVVAWQKIERFEEER